MLVLMYDNKTRAIVFVMQRQVGRTVMVRSLNMSLLWNHCEIIRKEEVIERQVASWFWEPTMAI